MQARDAELGWILAPLKAARCRALPGVCRVAARAAGMRTVLWSVAVERYADHQGTAAAVRSVLARIRPGSIILAHDGGPPDRARTMAALPLLLRRSRTPRS